MYFPQLLFQETYMHMTLHAMLMIYMQKLGPGNYDTKKELTSKYSQTCKPMHKLQHPEKQSKHKRTFTSSHTDAQSYIVSSRQHSIIYLISI